MARFLVASYDRNGGELTNVTITPEVMANPLLKADLLRDLLFVVSTEYEQARIALFEPEAKK